MDRFIAVKKYIPNIPKYSLKSNMDRFIGLQQQDQATNLKRLKSNMDRFIASALFALYCCADV